METSVTWSFRLQRSLRRWELHLRLARWLGIPVRREHRFDSEDRRWRLWELD